MGTEIQELIINGKWGYLFRILLNLILFQIRVVHFGKSGSHKLVSFYTMCDLSRHLQMLFNCYNGLYNNAIRKLGGCVIIV